MKKLTLLLSLVVLSFAASSQTINRLPLSKANHTNSVTISNSGADSLIIAVGNSSSVRIQANVLKVSGTPSANVTLQASQDGINFEPISTQLSGGTIGFDTLKVTNVAGVQTHSFIVPTIQHNVYMLICKGSGTMAATFSAFETEVLSPVYFKK